MSGLYNAIFKEHPIAPLVVGLLHEVQEFDPGRLRDAWVEIAGDWIQLRVHTRNGGGNRESQARAIESMRAHPWYVRDEDMEFDSTYADFYFAPPTDFDQHLQIEGLDVARIRRALVHYAEPAVDMSARWADVIESIREGRP